jgi:hypothetical protein
VFRSLVTLAALASALVIADRAEAFCRTSTCDAKFTGTQCTPMEPADCGTPLAWPSACVSFSMQKGASKQISLGAATPIFEKAFMSWMNATCTGGGHPHIEVVDLGPVDCAKHEYNQQSSGHGNANIIVFRDDGWPHAGQGDTLALTTVTYNLDTGEIYDADMEINSTQGHFTTGDTGVQDDLLSVATHEAGHFLGLAHTPVKGATMTAEYIPGSVDLRTLDADDIAAICAVYPPAGAIPSTCDPSPRYGFASDCGSDSPTTKSGCCSVAPGSPADRSGREIGAAAFLLALAGVRLFGQRRRKAARALAR